MLRSNRWPLLAGLAVLLATMLSNPALQAQTPSPLKAGDKAPDLTVQLLDGKSVSLKDLRGKVVYLDFFATWCGPCMQALPQINEVQKKLKSQGLVVLAVSLDDNKQAPQKLASDKSKGWAVTFAHDPQAKSAQLYRFNSIPHGVLIDTQGTIKAVHSGYKKGMAETLEKEIKPLLPKQPSGK